ncbi:hypothetical protein DFJ74DRAFT_128731 [Hyaloraphidium curvatum]|nr:hypothetical protein DFJ74DRAFT_128731 [Hyaloraphidium curvatum]
MVGERYRELIDAADSIMAMRSGAQAIEGMFSELQERCNIALLKRPGSGAEAGGDAASADRDAMVHRVAAQIKLLVDTPEQIWYNLERTHYLQAAQLYLVAKHVFRSLQTMRDSSSVHTLDTFPVARRQWDAVSRFQSQIMQKTRQNLKFVHQSDQAIANSICAMILLERISIKQAIAAFFDMRRAAMQELFSSFDAGSTNVAEFLAEVANLLFVTVRHAWGVFGATPNSKSLLETTLASLADAGGPAPSSALAPAKSGSTATDDVQSGWLAGLYSERTNVHIMARHLPPNLREQTAAGDDLIFAPSDLAEEAAVWMHETTDLARTGMRQVLRSISSGQHLWATRRALMADVAREESSVQKGSGRTRQGGAVSTGEADHGHLTSNSPWAEICRALLGRPVSLWASIMQEPFVERAKDIIRQAFKELAQQPEAVVAPFVERFRTSPSGQDKFGPDAASLQTRSMSPWTMTVSEISSSFERTIRNIQEDVEVLLKDKGGVPVDSVPSPLEQGNLHLEQWVSHALSGSFCSLNCVRKGWPCTAQHLQRVWSRGAHGVCIRAGQFAATVPRCS